MAEYDQLPEHMRDGARRYIEEGYRPGDFLMSVLCNDFVGAIGRADMLNNAVLHIWAQWLHNDIPMSAWGSVEKVEAWMKYIREARRSSD